MNKQSKHSLLAKPIEIGLAAALVFTGYSAAQTRFDQAIFTLTTSEITYSASDPNESWQGVTTLKSLTLTPIENGLELSATVEPGSFSSGNFIRDGNARFSLFAANEFPTATLSGTLPLEPEMLLPGDVSRTQETMLEGTLLLHGVERPLSTPVTVTRKGSGLSARTSFPVTMSAFDMETPSLFGVVVNDEVLLGVSVAGEVTAP